MKYRGPCWNCRGENCHEYRKDKEMEALGWVIFDCLRCGEGSMVGKDNNPWVVKSDE